MLVTPALSGRSRASRGQPLSWRTAGAAGDDFRRGQKRAALHTEVVGERRYRGHADVVLACLEPLEAANVPFECCLSQVLLRHPQLFARSTDVRREVLRQRLGA